MVTREEIWCRLHGLQSWPCSEEEMDALTRDMENIVAFCGYASALRDTRKVLILTILTTSPMLSGTTRSLPSLPQEEHSCKTPPVRKRALFRAVQKETRAHENWNQIMQLQALLLLQTREFPAQSSPDKYFAAIERGQSCS